MAIFLINENNQIIASTTFAENGLGDNRQNKTDAPELKRLEDADNHNLKLVNQTLQANELSIKDIVANPKNQTQCNQNQCSKTIGFAPH